MWFSPQKCHSFGAKLRQFRCKSTALLGWKYGGFGMKIWSVEKKTIDHFWKNDRSVVYGTIDRF